MRIPFHKMNLKMELHDLIKINEILESGQVVKGKYINALEENFKIMRKVKHAIACSSCTSGLLIALDAGGFSGGTVAMPAFTWPSTYYAAKQNYNLVKFCDIDKDTWLIDYNEITDSADIIMAVDTFGNRCPKLRIDKPVIYDAAHGYGLIGLGHRGLAEVVSFSYTKVVTGMQGGIILTNDDKLAERARELVDLYAKMTEINAYICIKTMHDYVQNLKNRKDIVDLYCDNLKIPYQLQEIPDNTNLSVFSILLEDQEKRDRVAVDFIKNGIEVKIYYKPLYQDSFLSVRSNTREVYSRIIALPTWFGVQNYIKEICGIINNA